MARRQEVSQAERALESAHASVCRAGFLLVVMLIKRRFSVSSAEAIVEMLERAARELKVLISNARQSG